MDGLGQLFVAQNGSVYALVPAQEREPLPPRRAVESSVTQALLAQFLQRQQQQSAAPPFRQQQLSFQLDNLAVPNLIAHQREEVIQELLQTSILQSLQGQANANEVARPSTSSHLEAVGQRPSRRRPPSVESPSNSDSQSPPPSARGGDRSDRSNHNGLGVSTQISAKEKNRQAQRRFRERQKDLIANLKQRVEELQTKVIDSEKEIIALKEENAMLRGRMEAKQQAPSVTLPAETLQSLLQMTGAGNLLAEVANTAGKHGGGRVSAGGWGSPGGGSGEAGLPLRLMLAGSGIGPGHLGPGPAGSGGGGSSGPDGGGGRYRRGSGEGGRRPDPQRDSDLDQD